MDENIPSLIIPFFGLFMIQFDIDGVQKFGKLVDMIIELESKGDLQNLDKNVKCDILSKVCSFAVFPYLNENIDFEWDVFDSGSTRKLMELVEVKIFDKY